MTESSSDMEWAALVPSEETAQFAATARAQFRSLFPRELLRSIYEGAPAPLDSWDALVDQGYTAIGLPDEIGGIGGLPDLVALLEVAGRSLLPMPLLASVCSMQTLLRAGLDIADLADDRSAIAVGGGAGLRVVDAAHAQWITVVRPHSEGLLVTRAEIGTAIVDHAPIDPTRPTATVSLGAVLDERMLAAQSLDTILAPARVCIAADLLGVGSLALDGAIEHAKSRQQFGRAIGSFQAVKHMLADTYVALERARSLTAGAASELAARPHSSSATRLSLFAKAAASEAATRATEVQTQLLGAMGLTYESDNHLMVRRARQTAAWLGSASDLYVSGAGITNEGGAR